MILMVVLAIPVAAYYIGYMNGCGDAHKNIKVYLGERELEKDYVKWCLKLPVVKEK